MREREKKEKTKAKEQVSFRVAMKKMISIDLGIGINGPSSPFYAIDCRKGCWVIHYLKTIIQSMQSFFSKLSRLQLKF
jgi:hypothetical protein